MASIVTDTEDASASQALEPPVRGPQAPLGGKDDPRVHTGGGERLGRGRRRGYQDGGRALIWYTVAVRLHCLTLGRGLAFGRAALDLRYRLGNIRCDTLGMAARGSGKETDITSQEDPSSQRLLRKW